MLASKSLFGQDIQYSSILGEKPESTEFRILPTSDTGLLIYKRHLNDSYVDFYNARLRIADEQKMDWLPFPCLKVSVVALSRQVLVLFQYQKKERLLCGAAFLDSRGRLIGKPNVLWETRLSLILNPPIFQIARSENRKYILLSRIRRLEDSRRFDIECLLLDDSAHVLNHATGLVPLKGDQDQLSRFQVNDQGDVYFLNTLGTSGFESALSSIQIGFKPVHDSSFYFIKMVKAPAYLADDPQLKLDNVHKMIHLYDWFLDSKKKHYVGILDASGPMRIPEAMKIHTWILSASMLGDTSDKKHAVSELLETLHIRKCLTVNADNHIVIAESVVQVAANRYQYGSVYLFMLGAGGRPVRIIRISKIQGAEISPDYSSFFMMNSGARLRFLYNKSYKSGGFLPEPLFLLTDTELDSHAVLNELPLFRNLDRKHHWLLRYGVQTGLNQAVFPCVYGSNLIFARLLFPRKG